VVGFFASPSLSGTINSSSAYTNVWVATKKAQMALYSGSGDGSTLMTPQSEEKTSGTAGAFNTFNFSSGPSITGGNNYLIAILGNGSVNEVKVTFDSGQPAGSKIAMWSPVTYNSWSASSTVGSTLTTYRASIYATYTASGGATRVPRQGFVNLSTMSVC
jgi:hypothetical protein